jgi:pimeloyl-ACP methyl ester carboxylesterase
VIKPAAMLAAIVGLCGMLPIAPAAGTATSSVRPHHVRQVPRLDGVNWGACHDYLYADLVYDAHVQCGNLRVPLDYSKPHGRQITLAVSLLRHTSSAKHYRGVMLSNPGGPGGGGLDLGPSIAPYVPHHVGGDFDWVSWDPRGVGASRPRLSCQKSYFRAPRLSYVPRTKHVLHYWLKRSKAYADACARHNPALIQHLSTLDSVRDMESIRNSLDVKKISYYGYSYGTYLGEVYSTLHPTHLKRMVLDSNVDPRRIWYQANLDQDRAFERAIKVYFRWVARYHRTYHLGTTGKKVYARYNATMRSLTKHPKGKLGPDEFNDAMVNAAYDRSEWDGLAEDWQAFESKGHTSFLLHEYQGSDSPGNDNEYAVYNGVQCSDVKWPQSWQRWQRDNNRYNKKYPFLTWNNAWYNAPCLFWHAKPHQPVKINGKATKSALLIDETRDAATPYSGSLEVRRLYPHASLIAEPGGTSHADSLDGDRCVDDKIAKYLATGNRPHRKPGRGADAKCAPLPAPHPSSSSFAMPSHAALR